MMVEPLLCRFAASDDRGASSRMRCFTHWPFNCTNVTQASQVGFENLWWIGDTQVELLDTPHRTIGVLLHDCAASHIGHSITRTLRRRVKLDLRIFGELEIPDEGTPFALFNRPKEDYTTTCHERCDNNWHLCCREGGDCNRSRGWITETNTTNRLSSKEHYETTKEKQPALLLPPVSKLKVVRKTKGLNVMPLVKKAIAGKKWMWLRSPA